MIKIPLESAKKGDIIIWKDEEFHITCKVTHKDHIGLETMTLSNKGKKTWRGKSLGISFESPVCREYTTAYRAEPEMGKELIKCKNNETITIELRKT